MSLDRSTPIAFDEQAVAEVVGTSLMVAVTVSVAAGLSAIMLGALPGPTGPTGFDLAASLEPECPWGDGDDHLVIEHRGGEAVKPSAITVHITSGAGTTEHPASAFTESGDADGLLEIGEPLTSPGLTLNEGETVVVDVVLETGAPRVVYSTTLHADSNACEVSP